MVSKTVYDIFSFKENFRVFNLFYYFKYIFTFIWLLLLLLLRFLHLLDCIAFITFKIFAFIWLLLLLLLTYSCKWFDSFVFYSDEFYFLAYFIPASVNLTMNNCYYSLFEYFMIDYWVLAYYPAQVRCNCTKHGTN